MTQKAKRVYSVNLAVFLFIITKKEPEYLVDEFGRTSFLFPDSQEITLLINMYRTGAVSVNLREFVSKFSYIKKQMYAAKTKN